MSQCPQGWGSGQTAPLSQLLVALHPTHTVPLSGGPSVLATLSLLPRDLPLDPSLCFVGPQREQLIKNTEEGPQSQGTPKPKGPSPQVTSWSNARSKRWWQRPMCGHLACWLQSRDSPQTSGSQAGAHCILQPRPGFGLGFVSRGHGREAMHTLGAGAETPGQLPAGQRGGHHGFPPGPHTHRE